MEKLGVHSTYAEAATYFNGYLWFVSGDLPYLYRTSIFDGVTVRIAKIGPYRDRKQYLFYSIIGVESRLYLIPWTADAIYIYDIIIDELYTLEMDDTHKEDLFCGAVFTGRYIFAFCPMKPILMRVDTISHDIDFCHLNIDIPCENGFYFSGRAICENNHIVFTLRNKCEYVVMDIEDMSYSVNAFIGIEFPCYEIIRKNNYYICSPENGENPIVVLDMDFKVIKKIKTMAKKNLPICIFNMGEKIEAFSLDETLAIEGINVNTYHHGTARFMNGIVAFNKDRKRLLVCFDDGYRQEINIAIPLDKEITNHIKDGVLIEGFMQLKDFIDIICEGEAIEDC